MLYTIIIPSDETWCFFIYIRKTAVCCNNVMYIVEWSCERKRVTNFGLHIRYRSQWPRGLRRRSAGARMLRLWVRIPLGEWKSVYCECCVLSGRCLCCKLITRQAESYRLWRVVVCDLETSRRRRPWPAWGRNATKKFGYCNFQYIGCTGQAETQHLIRRVCAVVNWNNTKS
jgi:hypothetical protein